MNSAPLLPRCLVRGDLIPWFAAPLIDRQDAFGIDKDAGRLVLMLFFGSAVQPACVEALRMVDAHRGLFDGEQTLFFGVSIDPVDLAEGRMANKLPGIRFFNDTKRSISLACGAVKATTGPTDFETFWLLLDSGLRVADRFALGKRRRPSPRCPAQWPPPGPTRSHRY